MPWILYRCTGIYFYISLLIFSVQFIIKCSTQLILKIASPLYLFFNREDEICAHNIYISFYIWYGLYSLLKCVHKSFKSGSHVLQTLGQNIHTSSLLLTMTLTLTSTINNKYCYYYCFGARLSFMSIKHKKNKNMI